MVIHPSDTVEVREDGHKYALRPIAPGELVIKYGMPIGRATRAIAAGEHVHTQNLATGLTGQQAYTYAPDFTRTEVCSTRTFEGFVRPDGQVGVRNDIWVIPTVGCVNHLATRLAEVAHGFALTHPYGCSQMGEDHERTVTLLAALARHPNAGGVLVVGLGCENNTLERFRERVGACEDLNIRFLRAQDVGDEFEAGCRAIHELKEGIVQQRTTVPLSRLVVGLKCGGSDGFSGITANPVVGRFSDFLIREGGTTVLTEVPEMFGAETLLMNRCVNHEVFQKCVSMVNGFKDYFEQHHQVVYENPSPGNKDGGITTLEDKSLGCVQKGGHSPVADVLDCGSRVTTSGLNLLAGPGNDLVASTLLAASGCHLILFTTGRGTPFGSVIPTLKIASNSELAERKPHWIDFDAGRAETLDQMGQELAERVIQTASGIYHARNEIMGYREIALFKSGVTL